MAKVHCQRFPDCMALGEGKMAPTCGRNDCPGAAKKQRAHDFVRDLFFHSTPKPDACDHDFRGGRDLTDDEGRVCGFTTVCTKCGMDAMTYSLRCGE